MKDQRCPVLQKNFKDVKNVPTLVQVWRHCFTLGPMTSRNVWENESNQMFLNSRKKYNTNIMRWDIYGPGRWLLLTSWREQRRSWNAERKTEVSRRPCEDEFLTQEHCWLLSIIFSANHALSLGNNKADAHKTITLSYLVSSESGTVPDCV